MYYLVAHITNIYTTQLGLLKKKQIAKAQLKNFNFSAFTSFLDIWNS